MKYDSDGRLLVTSGAAGAGDASAANQTAQIALETEIRDRLPATPHSQPLTDAQLRAAALPVTGSAAVGTAPSLPPLSVSGVDGGGLKRHILTDTGGRQVVVAAPPIEARTNVGALAASVTAFSDILDLGPAATRQHTRIVAQKIGLVSAGETLQLLWSDDGTTWYGPAPSALGSATNSTAWTNASNASMHAQSVPMGRYARALFNNGSAPQTALLVAVTAIAGI